MAEANVAISDLSECDREPIHIPGAIQPHGYLFILNAADHTVISVSQNTADALELLAADMIGRDVTDFLATTTAEKLNDVIGARDRVAPIRARLRRGSRTEGLDGFVRVDDGLVLLELEASASAELALNLFRQTQSAIEHIRQCGSTERACKTLAIEVRRLSGFDRVMVYQFDPDWNGVVIAEDKSEDVESYEGHAFPASDIPAQARALYTRNATRVIPNARYTPSPLEPTANPLTGRAFDLSDVALRSVSPIHLEYLANMGVAASMSVSIIRDNKLWALVACHHSSPRLVPRAVLQACDLLAQTVAGCLDAQTRALTLAIAEVMRRLESDPVAPTEPAPYFRQLEAIAPTLMSLTGAQGMAICNRETVWAAGKRPSDDQMRALAEWLSQSGCERVTTDHLPELYSAAAEFRATASGIAAVKLDGRWLIFFRAEWFHTLKWAGQPEKSALPDGGQINPRKSFATWLQTVRGRSSPWDATHVFAADEAQKLILRMVVADQIHSLSSALSDANHALSAVAISLSASTSQPDKIFVVDDDYFVREEICSLLQDFGWDVEPFSSCEDFLAAHKVGPNTCLVLDIHFPGMGGLELLRHMVEVADSTPVIVVSGSSGINEAVRSMKKGALDFIEKPVRRDQLVASVKRALVLSRQSNEISAARDAALAHLKGLTTRQKQIMAQVLAGHPSKNIAADLGISQRTVENHRAAIMNRTGASSLPALTQLVMSTRWTPDR